MDIATIIRAWKDPDFRESLRPEERAELPECPSGTPLTELAEADLYDVVGGRRPETYPGCPSMALRCTVGPPTPI